jgi:phage terminase large subunit
VNIDIPTAFAPLLESQKRYRIAVGGRGSGKSITAATMCLLECYQGKRVLACREFQSSIAESSHALMASLVDQIGLPGFTVTRDRITHTSGGEIIYRGLARSPETLKSLAGIYCCFLDEAQTISDESLRILTPTIREPGSYFIMTANPRSSGDAFSVRFLNEHMSKLRTDKIAEDEMSTIVKVDWDANPFIPAELIAEKENDRKTMTPELWAHVWQGEHYDSVTDALVDVSWFEAALVAEEKFKYRPSGAKVLGFDPADTGPDPAGLAVRHGAKVLDLGLRHEGNVSEAFEWSLEYLDRYHCSNYVYDGDGLGLGLAREVERALAPRDIHFEGFRGGATPTNPSAMFSGFKSNRDAYYNRRAQDYWEIRERFWKTYQAVEGEFMDPDELIFLPKEHPLIDQLRSEICRIPTVPNQNGKIQIMPKGQMAKPPLNIPSPNLADALVYAFTVDDYISGSWGKPIEYKEAYI